VEKITSVTQLREAIFLLEIKQVAEKQLLKDEFKTTFENLQPINLIKKTLSELTTAPNFKGKVLNAILSIGAGYLSKKVMIGATHNPLKQILGAALQIGVTKTVSENSENIKGIATSLLSKLFNNKSNQNK
jgi:hypothetical protein